MYIAAAILSILLAAVALAAGAPKVVLKGSTPAHLQSHMGLSPRLVRFIGFAEFSAAAGLIVGLFWRPLGIAAAVGFAILLTGATGFHARAGDYADPKTRAQAMAPIVLALVAIAAAVTLTLAI